MEQSNKFTLLFIIPVEWTKEGVKHFPTLVKDIAEPLAAYANESYTVSSLDEYHELTEE